MLIGYGHDKQMHDFLLIAFYYQMSLTPLKTIETPAAATAEAGCRMLF
jgi:hypothetical protein